MWPSLHSGLHLYLYVLEDSLLTFSYKSLILFLLYWGQYDVFLDWFFCRFMNIMSTLFSYHSYSIFSLWLSSVKAGMVHGLPLIDLWNVVSTSCCDRLEWVEMRQSCCLLPRSESFLSGHNEDQHWLKSHIIVLNEQEGVLLLERGMTGVFPSLTSLHISLSPLSTCPSC